jgi:hypothetical protein
MHPTDDTTGLDVTADVGSEGGSPGDVRDETGEGQRSP